MWSFLYRVPASAAALLKQFEQQTGQLPSPGTTCTLTQCSPPYVRYCQWILGYLFMDLF